MHVNVFDFVITICVLMAARYLRHVETAEVVVGVARAVPLLNRIISGTAFLQIPVNSRIKCLSECSRRNCSSFNFGNGECHLYNTYLCADQTLIVLSGFKYYDVEYGDMIPIADVYRTLPDCLLLGRCSPKCYIGTTTVTISTTTTTTAATTTTTTTTTTPAPTTTTSTPAPTTTTTTTTPAPTTTTTTPAPTTTTTTPAPTTTTTTPAPTTTTTTPATTTTTTTPAPTTTTTTPAPTTTTTTPAPTTTTTTPAPTTTTTTPAPTTTESSAPGPGDVNYACSIDDDCTAPNADCRNNVVCECVAGYSYNPPTKSCVTTCPGAFDNTFSLTAGFYVHENNYQILAIDPSACRTACEGNPSCASYEFDQMLYECHLSVGTKNDGTWLIDGFFEYYQRNCL